MLVCTTFSTALWAENGTQVYIGTVGKTPIVLEVNANGSDGRYFYQKYRGDLVLTGKKEGETLILDEGNPPAKREASPAISLAAQARRLVRRMDELTRQSPQGRVAASQTPAGVRRFVALSRQTP